MRRLVYSPKVNVFVKSDVGIFDLSPFVTDCTVNRKVNSVSSATVTFRNPEMMFTEYQFDNGEIGPVFHPMDPIIIAMTRIRDKPIQVFTGYCDTTPYVQLHPGTVSISASCTLKRLMYTYWDPGLPFVQDFLTTFGWAPNPAINGVVNAAAEAKVIGADTKQLNDGSLGALLAAILQYVGHWDPKTFYIEALPRDIVQLVTKLFQQIEESNKEAQAEFDDLLQQMIGGGAQGNGGDPTNPNDIVSGPVTGAKDIVKTITQVANLKGIPPVFALTVAYIETRWTGVDSSLGYKGWYQWDNVNGPPGSYAAVGVKGSKSDGAHDLGFACSLFCDAANAWKKRNAALANEANWWAWASHIQGVTQGFNNSTTPALNGNALYLKPSFDGFVRFVTPYYNKYGSNISVQTDNAAPLHPIGTNDLNAPK